MAAPAAKVTEQAVALTEGRLVEVRDLSVHFPVEDDTIRAVDGVSWHIGRGETVALVGESGSGKSVSAMALLRLTDMAGGRIVSGEVRFRRRVGACIDIVQQPPRAMRDIRGNDISMIFQEPMTSLNPLYAVGSQIAEAVELHQNMNRKEALNRALEMLHKVHISDPEQRLHQYPHQLSGGMRQRVMIALALSCNPSILIADEPTTALDVTVQAQILDLMRKLQNDFDSAIVMITHNLGVVSQIADHVAVMYLGKVVEYAPVRPLFHEPIHPYTIGLLDSVPVLGKKGKKILVPIKGIVPSPTEDIQGCAFADRCSKVMDVCRKKEPALREVKPRHEAACWLYE
jgi:oligopeptide/dipeptide ABC transporter ATP-binding protein